MARQGEVVPCEDLNTTGKPTNDPDTQTVVIVSPLSFGIEPRVFAWCSAARYPYATEASVTRIMLFLTQTEMR